MADAGEPVAGTDPLEAARIPGPAGIPSAPAAPEPAAPEPGARWTSPSIGRWLLFAALAIGIVVADQIAKAWVTGNLDQGKGVVLLGDWLRIVHWRNTGILFGMLPRTGSAFALVSLAVAALIVVYHAKAGRGIVVTIALGLLLGGALGNLADRVRYGDVVDFVDMGIGAWRFYTYNLADAAITTAIILLIVTAVVPRVGDWAPDAPRS
jgi:signal peptidase II